MFVLTAVLSAWAQDVWDGSIATEFAGGSGTQDDPYLISDGAELAYLSKITNEDASQTQGKYYRLTSDIILNENVLNKDYELNGTPANLWTPIADVTYYGIGNGSFYGDFNGDGYVISGLYCYNSSSGYVYCGLFGSLGGDAVVHNVAIIDSYSKCTSYTSGLVAANLTDNAVVRCCYVDGYSYGGQYGGLLVGTPTNYMNTLIEYCYTKGVSNGGGLTGYMSSSNAMRKCYAVALGMSCVVKQVTGYKELTDLYYDSTLASISDSYATGKTTTEMQSKEFAELLGEPFVYEQGNYPGIEGLPAIGETSNNKSGYKINVGDLTNGGGSKIKFYSFYDGTSLKKSVRRAEADMTVYLQVNIASNLLLAEADLKVTNDETGISIALKKEADGIWSFTMPEASVTTTARFYKNPHAAGVWDGSVATSFAGGTGRADDPYLISNGEELAYLAQITKANPNQTSGKFYRLTDNILLNEDVLTDDFSLNGTPENGWMPIGDPDNTWDYTGNGFKGNFDGAGYCVSGLYCVHNGQIIGLFGSIESSAEIHDLSVVDSYVSGGRFTGAIAGGNNGGKIYRCYAEAYVCNADYAGVAVGHTEGTVEYCYASGRVEGSNRGGVLGWVNYGSYANCFSTVIGGGTSGSSRTGTNSYYDSNINTSGGYGTAKTTAEMQSEEFTQLLGEPFVYAEGYYPYIEGLLKIGEQPIFSSAGYRLSVGKLTNGSGSALTFHTSYDDAAAGKNTRSMEAGQTVYLKLKPRCLMFLADGTLKVINDSTGLSLTLTPIAENIWSFIMPAFSVTASAGFYRDPNAPLLWDGTIAQTFAEGDGSEDDPYLISTPDELAYLSQLTNANGALTQGKYYQLAADICLNDQMLNGNYELEGIPENVWTPIGNSSNNSFKGVFDGNNHTISGVYIPDGNDCSGLFGTIDGATVNDLSLIDTYVKGSNYTGGLVGQVAYNDSCFIKRCYVEANVTSTNSYSGVLIGYSYYYGVIENCYAAGRASASSYPAGICGQNYYSKVHNCFSAVTGVKAIGYDWNGTNTNVYHDSNLTGSTFNSGDLFRSAATVEMQTTDFAARMGAPFEYVLGNYPYIPGLLKIGENRGWTTPTDPTHGGAGGTWDGEASLVFAGGTGTETDPYIINNGSQLAYLAKLTNANCQLTAGRYYQLGADIKLNEQVLTDDFVLKGTPANIWEPIGLTYDKAFKGRFDGNNYTISGVYIPDGNDCTGLFGAIDSATVNDLSLIDTYVKGSNYTGGLVGQVAYNDSCFIKRCFVEANVTSTNSYSGVLAGYSYYYGVIENCYAAGRASASSYPAGICGQNYYSKVHNCFSAVTGAKAIGYDWYGTNTNVYHDSNLTGSTFNSGDLFRSAETTEMLSTDFAARMGEPFEYSVGYYPYIYGLHKIDKNGKTAIMTGYSLLLGTLTNGSGCSIAFYRNYTGKTGELADVVKSGEKVLLNGSTKIYAKVTVADGKLLSGNGLSVIATTGGEIAVTEIAAGLYQFTMPESAVTVSAKFLFGGFCGRTDVNDGQNLIWSIDDGVLTFQQNTVTTGSLDMNSFTADGTPWHSQAGKVKAIDLGNATSIGDNAFANCISVAGIDLGATPITVGRNAFAKSTCLIVPAASYADYQTSWSEYASQLEKDKETLTMKEGQQWRTCYSRVGRTLPASLKAYIVRDIEGSQVITGNALDYIPAGQAVLIEHSDKTGITAEATTSGAPYSEENKTPVCQLTTSEANLLQWLDSPMNVSAAQGYTLYKDEFVMVSSGILPAGIAFLPAQGGSGASSLSIFATENNMTAVELPTLDAVGTDIWYTIDGKRLSGMPTQKGLYICNGRKVVIK